MTNTGHPPRASGLAALAPSYRALLCDVWGVVHDGVKALHDAGMALTRFRNGGGKVLLITNAPRLRAQVVAQLDRFGVQRDAYDDVMTSGEAARAYLAASPGVAVYHLGPDRDLP